jgi:hypothetical protein
MGIMGSDRRGLERLLFKAIFGKEKDPANCNPDCYPAKGASRDRRSWVKWRRRFSAIIGKMAFGKAKG